MLPDVEQPRVPGSVVGIVIAGGRSTRFGGEKAVAGLGDKPLLMWAALRLQRSCEAVAVNVRPGTEAQSLARSESLPLLYAAPGERPRPLPAVPAAPLRAP